MGDAHDDPKPLEVPLVGHRRVLVDVDGADWRVAFYYPVGIAEGKVRELEKRARTGSQKERDALARVKVERSTGRGPLLRDALTRAMTRRIPERYGIERVVAPDLAEVETIATYILSVPRADDVRMGKTA